MARFMVSYQRHDGKCGNQTFDTMAKATLYINAYQFAWTSYSVFSYNAGQTVGVLTYVEM